MRVSRRWISNRAISTELFWQIAILTAAGTIGAVSHADAALYYWQDSDPGFYRPAPPIQPRRQRTPRRSTAKTVAAQKETSAKPQGPLIIAVSIDKQKVRIFDDNGVFAEAPVSTGMRGHPTPTGVFSVIQKHKFHHSNIYSGAPMPYMQRITWSGVAMHAGVLPGYPASHGCIRMPMAFAVKMWNWTKMGARVFVTPGEIMTPTSFSHPLLAAMKVVPQPVAADVPPTDKPAAAKTDKGAADAKPASSEAALELRSTVGHIDAAKPAATEVPDTTSLREQTHTAYASGDARVTKSAVTMSDASAGSNAPAREEAATKTQNPPPAIKDGAAVNTADASKTEVKSEPKKSDSDDAAAKHDETPLVADSKPTEAKPAETATAETKPAETAVAETAAKKPEEAAAATTVTNDTPKVETKADEPSTASVKAEEKTEQKSVETAKVEAKPASAEPQEAKVEGTKVEEAKSEAAKPEVAKPEVAKSEIAKAEPAKTETAKSEAKSSEAKPSEAKPSEAKSEDKAKAAAIAADAKKDQARLDAKPVVTKPEPPKRSGQIAALISRKDSKLYVRQNFAPLFDTPITIAASDRPLGTHVFTAEVDKNDANVLHWSVVSLPMSAKSLQRNQDQERVSRRRRVAAAGPVEMKPLPVPDSPAEALDRITVPTDVMARITEALATGGSIIVSDQGINQGETGEGTDFIVSLR
jgi:lipoprotein-anchoring transpeptidase ErfK/SrfK